MRLPPNSILWNLESVQEVFQSNFQDSTHLCRMPSVKEICLNYLRNLAERYSLENSCLLQIYWRKCFDVLQKICNFQVSVFLNYFCHCYFQNMIAANDKYHSMRQNLIIMARTSKNRRCLKLRPTLFVLLLQKNKSFTSGCLCCSLFCFHSN